MDYTKKILIAVVTAGGCLCCVATAQEGIRCKVETEEVVTKYAPANNGAGPLWCYGSTVIARDAGDVYLSVIETGKEIPPLCNTRWQLWRRSSDGWRVEQAEKDLILRTLEATAQNKTRAAEILGISLKTLHNKLKKYRERA